MANQPPSFRYPGNHPDPETNNYFRLAFNAITDLQSALMSVNDKAVANGNSITTINQQITATTGSSSSTPAAAFPVNVNQQSASYILQQTDAAGLIVFSGTGPYTLTLNNGVTRPFFCAVLNLSSAVVTASTTGPFLVNNGPSVSIPVTLWAFFYFDGINWWALDLQIWPQTKAPVGGQVLDGYDATTGQFHTTSAAGINFADDETVAGSGTAFTLAHAPSPTASLQLFQVLAGFGSVLLRPGVDYTLSGTSITTVNTLSAGDLTAWYRY